MTRGDRELVVMVVFASAVSIASLVGLVVTLGVLGLAVFVGCVLAILAGGVVRDWVETGRWFR